MALAKIMVHVRVDEKTKTKATKALAAMGISVSDAVRIMLIHVAAKQALPFEIKVPNKTTTKGRKFDSATALFKYLNI